MLLMDRFPTTDEILQLPCLPLTLTAPPPPTPAVGEAAEAGPPAAPAAAATVAAAAGHEDLAVHRTPLRQPQQPNGLVGSLKGSPVSR